MSGSSCKWMIAFTTLVVALVPVSAQEKLTSDTTSGRAEQKAEKKNKKSAAEKPSAGLVITVDPKTHQVRQATPEEIHALAERRKAETSAAQTAPGLARRGEMRSLRHASGADGVQLDDSYMTSMVATIEPDGKVNFHCDEGKKQGTAKPAAKEKTNEK